MNLDTVLDAYNEVWQGFGTITAANTAEAHRAAMKAAIAVVVRDCAQEAEDYLAKNPNAVGPDVRDWLSGRWSLLLL